MLGRVVRLLLVGLLLVCTGLLAAGPATADSQTGGGPDGVTYSADPGQVGQGATAIGYTGSGGHVLIPDNVTIGSTSYAVTGIAAETFAGKNLSSVELGDNVRAIGEHAFGNNEISALVVPSSVNSIGHNAFFGNAGLTRVEFLGAVPDTFWGRDSPWPSLGNNSQLVVRYRWGHAEAAGAPGGFTTPTWHDYRTVPIVTVSFDMNGHGSQVGAVTMDGGQTVAKPPEPSSPGLDFLAWYAVGSGEPFNFNTSVGQNLTLRAKWGTSAGISGAGSAQFTVGEADSYSPVVGGVPAPVVTASGLPAGLVADSSTGTISGTPKEGAVGTHQVELTASNGLGSSTKSVAVTVHPAPMTDVAVSILPTSATPGDQVTVTGSGLGPGAKVELHLASMTEPLGTVVADLNGNFSLTTTLPSQAVPGNHTIVATVVLGGERLTASTPFIVLSQTLDAAVAPSLNPPVTLRVAGGLPGGATVDVTRSDPTAGDPAGPTGASRMAARATGAHLANSGGAGMLAALVGLNLVVAGVVLSRLHKLGRLRW